MEKKAYARAGVDIDLGNKVKSTLPGLLAATHRKEVLGKVGGFGYMNTTTFSASTGPNILPRQGVLVARFTF